MDALLADDIPITFFALDPETELPTPLFKGYNEHAAVINGFDEQSKVVEIAHWGKCHLTTFDDLFKSAMVLPDTREAEYYEPAFFPTGERNKYKKYVMIRDPSTRDLSAPFIKRSITPEDNTGFKARLLVVKKPELINILTSRELLAAKFSIKPPVDRLTFLKPPAVSLPEDGGVAALEVATKNLSLV